MKQESSLLNFFHICISMNKTTMKVLVLLVCIIIGIHVPRMSCYKGWDFCTWLCQCEKIPLTLLSKLLIMQGNILYQFPSLQRTASSKRSGRKEYVGKRWADWVGGVGKFFREKTWQFRFLLCQFLPHKCGLCY